MQKINGIGKMTDALLRDLWGIQTIADLWAHRHSLPIAFGPKQSEFLLACSLGFQGIAAGENQEGRSEDEEEGAVGVYGAFGEGRKSHGISRTLAHHPFLIGEQEEVVRVLSVLADFCPPT